MATDTLAVRADGTPFKFTSKAFIVPHLQLVIAGTGLAGFLGRWFVRINDGMIVKGIDNLNYHTPQALASLWQDCKQELSIPEGMTTTVYHFGSPRRPAAFIPMHTDRPMDFDPNDFSMVFE